MSRNRFVFTALTIFLLLGTIFAATGRTQNTAVNTTLQPQTFKPQDGSYCNVTVYGFTIVNDNRTYAYLGLTDKVNGHYKALVQISPRSQIEAINMFTFLNSAYREQKPVGRIDIVDNNISLIEER